MHFGEAAAERLDRPEREAFLPTERILSLLPFTGAVLADIGAGTGFTAFPAARTASKVYAVDVSNAMVDIMRRRAAERNVTNLLPILSTAEKIPLPDASVDAALSVSCFHDYEDESTVAETARILKPGGLFLVVDWDADAEPGRRVPGPPLGVRKTAEQVIGICGRFGLSPGSQGRLNEDVFTLLFRKN